MANYTKLTDFASKDSLPAGSPAKIVKGTEIDDEFQAIETAVSSKAENTSPSFNGTPTAPTPITATNTTQLATTNFVWNVVSQGDLRYGTATRSWGTLANYTSFNNSVGQQFVTNGAERMRLDLNGNLDVDGDITAYSSTISDERLKKDIKTLENPIEMLEGIRGVTFTYIKDDKKSAGVVAQDVEKVLPSAVIEKKLPFATDDDGEYKVVEYDQLHAILIEAVKELSERVKVLEGK